MYRAGPSRSGVHPGPAPVGEPVVAWTFKASDEFSFNAVVAGGTSSSEASMASCTRSTQPTGAERWRFEGAGPIQGSAATADGMVYTPDGGGALVALDASTGAVRWRADLDVADTAQASSGRGRWLGLCSQRRRLRLRPRRDDRRGSLDVEGHRSGARDHPRRWRRVRGRGGSPPARGLTHGRQRALVRAPDLERRQLDHPQRRDDLRRQPAWLAGRHERARRHRPPDRSGALAVPGAVGQPGHARCGKRWRPLRHDFTHTVCTRFRPSTATSSGTRTRRRPTPRSRSSGTSSS